MPQRDAHHESLRLARALVDEVRLLPDEEREAVLHGARLRRDALALAEAQGARPSAEDIIARVERFRRARGLLRVEQLEGWLRARASSAEDLSRWIRDEATLHLVGLSAASLAPRDLVDFARVAEGLDALWARAAQALSSSEATLSGDELAREFFDARGESAPEDLDAWAAVRGFDDGADALRAMRHRVDAAPTPARVEVGDPLPDRPLRHGASGALRLRDLAVRPTLVGLAWRGDDAAALRDRWRDEHSAVIVSSTSDDDPDAVPMLGDAEGSLWSSLGFERRDVRFLVLDAGARAAWIGDSVDAAEGALRARREARSPAAGFAPVLVVPAVFDDAECEALIARWRDHGSAPGSVTTTEEHARSDAAIKRRDDHVIADPALDAHLDARLRRRVGPSLRDAFHFVPTGHEGFRVGCYDAASGGRFLPHRDDANPSVRTRRFALSVNLSPDDYDGGSLELPEFGATIRAPRGAAVVYSASLLHAVTPVTRGRRFALVGFLLGRFRGG